MKNGFYWVRFPDSDEWQVGHVIEENVYLAGGDTPLEQQQLTFGPMVKPPPKPQIKKVKPRLIMYLHTSKAVKKGCPANRVFLVVDKSATKAYAGHLVAWKCTLSPRGLLHPAFKEPLPLTASALATGCIRNRAANGSEPTAIFKPDSLYRRVTLEDVRNCAQFTRQTP